MYLAKANSYPPSDQAMKSCMLSQVRLRCGLDLEFLQWALWKQLMKLTAFICI